MTKLRQLSMLTALVAVLIVLAGWFVLISPQHKHVADLRSQATEQDAANAGVQLQVKRLAAEKTDLPAEQAELAAIQQQIPGTPALSAYVRLLQGAATSAHVDLQSIAPDAAQTVAAAATASPTPAAATPGATSSASPAPAVAPENPPAAAGAPLQAINVKVTALGSYFQIQQFVAAIEKLPRKTVVSGIDLAPGQLVGVAASPGGIVKPPTTSDYDKYQTLSAQISVTIFQADLTGPSAAASSVAPHTPATVAN